MGFFNTFFKVWEIRVSAKIQQSIEDANAEARGKAELKSNMPKIIDELVKKNDSWSEKIEEERRKINGV